MCRVLERQKLLLPLPQAWLYTDIYITFYRHQMMEHIKSRIVDIPIGVREFICQSFRLCFFFFGREREKSKEIYGVVCQSKQREFGFDSGSGAVNFFF